MNWGAGADSGQGPYLFSRGTESWNIVAGSPQPSTGVQRVVPELFSQDATRVALEVDVHTSASLGKGESPEIKFETGPVGGPYIEAASVPRVDEEGGVEYPEGWVAASEDFSTLILQSEDHDLLGNPTGTTSGNDLYEYAHGHLTQVNAGIGSCGAHIVNGDELAGILSSSHAVSREGSDVFFEAVPGDQCEMPAHLYVRLDAAETVDMGQYRFIGANPSGTEVILEKKETDGSEYALYKLGTRTVKRIFGTHEIGVISSIVVSEAFDAFYVHLVTGGLYRYDLHSGALTYLFSEEGDPGRASPDGRFYYFQGSVPGVQGRHQVYLYDNQQALLQCISCASPFDPEPKLGAVFPHHQLGDLGPLQQNDGWPNLTFLSNDGRFAFFDSPAELVKSDNDGEVLPDDEPGAEHQSAEFSVSSNVYEWRRDGVDGCVEPQGCLALITDGSSNGFLNLLIGASPSGEDVFIYSLSKLAPQDSDNAGDIYDARVGGGFPAPPAIPVECENGSCAVPSSAPVDQTPGSMTFSGPTNIVEDRPSSKHKATKHQKKKRRKPKKRKRGRVRKAYGRRVAWNGGGTAAKRRKRQTQGRGR